MDFYTFIDLDFYTFYYICIFVISKALKFYSFTVLCNIVNL